jgi:glucose-6-phosphate 1-dehydrogenase
MKKWVREYTFSMQKPLTFVLFGATGDLAVKKIFPALASLLTTEELHPDSKIIAVGRRNFDTAAFQTFLKESWNEVPDELLAHITYADVDFDVRCGYENLKAVLEENEERDLMIYLSLAPRWFAQVIEDLRDAGILVREDAKLILEKPFGTDEASARKLNELLSSFLAEPQVYRVDHYLGKSALQAIMETHERSAGLRTILSNETVAKVTVELLETKGVEGRGASYDSVGAFRDVGQNHMLEALAVLLAEYPRSEEAHAWQKARADVLESLAPPEESVVVRIGQYDGYEEERGVEAGSRTETAFEVGTHFTKGELKGVPIVLRAGKKMPQAFARIIVAFKEIAGFPTEMRVEVQPEARVVMRYPDGTENNFPLHSTREAYANVILDVLQGDDRHFVGEREILASWRYADALVALFPTLPLQKYGVNTLF